MGIFSAELEKKLLETTRSLKFLWLLSEHDVKFGDIPPHIEQHFWEIQSQDEDDYPGDMVYGEELFDVPPDNM